MFVWLKSCFNIISKLIIIRTRLIELLLLFLDTFNKILKKKLSQEPKILRS